ncbi:2-hydroxyacid dehydrogenase [Salipaludibacillus aurantiacus]|uniref:Glyoxylate reductase n=1 Tax=Salipaludibacillus aurantiacus TaxID=1601833 RepID=A0A1H9WXC0_9BACI|nr:D-glycerate dehydrogenase [Salipaludibacillus aurantiacus]SES38053.1 glyoxylate reductase [Salipaludibacillus aurantiacus]
MSKPYVYVTRKVPEESLTALQEVAEVEMWPKAEDPVPREVLLEKAQKASGLYTMLSDQIDEELLDNSPHLKVVANLAVGFDNINVEKATEKGISVCNTPDVLTDTTADLAFALLMAAGRRIVEAAEYVKDGKWQNWAPLLLAGTDIHHKTIGIVGMGRIGTAVAKRATGFEMEILYHNRSRKKEAEEELGASYVSFEELTERADYVVCLAPLTEETKDLFTYDVFNKMKSSAVFVNASRGGVVVEEDLERALKEETIAAAGLDVFRKEPIPADHPLLSLTNVVALPHIGSASAETRHEMAALVSRNIASVLKGDTPEALVNEDVLS